MNYFSLLCSAVSFSQEYTVGEKCSEWLQTNAGTRNSHCGSDCKEHRSLACPDPNKAEVQSLSLTTLAGPASESCAAHGHKGSKIKDTCKLGQVMGETAMYSSGNMANCGIFYKNANLEVDVNSWFIRRNDAVNPKNDRGNGYSAGGI